jgi:hypothetical protein
VDCRPLPDFQPDDLASVRAAFGNAASIALRQAWCDFPEPGFAPGVVRTGWRDASLLVFAELSDADIFTHAERHNDRFWQMGDTFEMFLQPSPGQPYVELHVTPNNLHLQLRFIAPPGPDDDDPFGSALIHGDIFTSHTWVNRDAHEWCVFAAIPASVVSGDAVRSAATAPAWAGSDWRFSFGRYDYTHGRDRPIISSSSPHTEPAFHRPHEWGTLRFGNATAI